MKILHFIPSIDNAIGGPARSSTQLVKFLAKQNANHFFELHTIRSTNPIITSFEEANAKLIFHQKINSISLSGVDLVHLHGIWSSSLYLIARKSIKKNIPYIISIRGMLEPWSLSQKKIKKKLALLIYQKRILLKSMALHATSKEEVNSIRDCGINNPVITIPNGIDLQIYPKEIDTTRKYHSKKIVFLSRIHKKKGIEFLLEAFNQLNDDLKNGWTIDIIGEGDEDYLAGLRSRMAQLQLDDSVTFRGAIYGSEKNTALINSTIFVLPTFSENFGIAIAEALACYCPVITTTGAPWNELINQNAGDWIELSIDNLAQSLEKMMSLSFVEYDTMSHNAKSLVINRYSSDTLAAEMLSCYKSLLSGDLINNNVIEYNEK